MFSRCAARNQNIHQKDSNLHQQLHWTQTRITTIQLFASAVVSTCQGGT
jgi:hypothetical protein